MNKLEAEFATRRDHGEASGLVPARIFASGEEPPEASSGPMQPAARAVLRAMFEEHFAFIWRILRRLGVPPQNVDDAAQQVFYVAARKVDAIEPSKARSFLLGTALRIAAEARRSVARCRETASDALDAEPSAALNPEQLAEKKRALELLDVVLEAMPFELRAVFVLYEIEGMSTNDIAAALKLPRGTVSSRLRRAREEFHAIARRVQAARPMPRGGRP